MDRIGVSELFSSCPSTRSSRCHACRSSSRSARLRSESTRSWCGSPPSRNVRPRDPPAADAARERPSARSAASRPPGNPPIRVLRRRAQQPLGRLGQQPFRRPVRQPQALIPVEREDRDVDLAMTVRSKALASIAPSRCSCSVSPSSVDLDDDLTQRVVLALCAARANRVVALAQRGQQVRKRLERAHHPALRRRARTPPSSRRSATVSVHCTLGVKSPSHSISRETSTPGNPARIAMSRMRCSWRSGWVFRNLIRCGRSDAEAAGTRPASAYNP